MKYIIYIGLLCFMSGAVYGQTKSLGEIPIGSEKRIALLVGNQDYNKYSILKNPIRDVDSTAKVLRFLGFETISKYNLDYRTFIELINTFITKANQYDVALFYYSGHGMQFNGDNFLVPIDAKMRESREAESQCINMNRLYYGLEAAKVKNSLFFLDACRDNPFISEGGKGTTGGLAIPRNPRGSFVAYATKAGSTASDNPNDMNGLFTKELLRNIRIPNLGIRDIMDRTLIGVENASNGQQIPGRYDELRGDFIFIQDKTQKENSYKPEKKESPTTNTNNKPNLNVYSLTQSVVEIPAGSFIMGLNGTAIAERPSHEVRLNSFYISPFEVSVGVWKEYCRVEKKDMPDVVPDWGWQDNHPIVGVNWFEAISFCNWLSSINNLTPAYIIHGTDVEFIRTASGFRLPTEAEWEFAARGGNPKDTFFFAGSDDQSSVAWWYDNSKESTHAISLKLPNSKGLYDMSGNVWEWCWDWYDETYYRSSEKNNPTGPTSGKSRVLRGGSWLTNENRVCLRQGYTPQTQTIDLGFRVVRNY